MRGRLQVNSVTRAYHEFLIQYIYINETYKNASDVTHTENV